MTTTEPGDGVVVGEYKVAFSDINPEDYNTELPVLSEVPKPGLPNKYLNADTSGLTFKVEPGSQTKNFELE